MSTGSALTRTTLATRQSKKSGKSLGSKGSGIQDMCQTHRRMRLDLFCVDHQSLICTLCKDSDHVRCSTVLPVDEAATNYSQTDAAIEWGKTLRKLLSQCNTVVKERRADEKELKTSKSDIERYVQNYRKSIVDKLDKLVTGILKQVDDIYQRETAKIRSNILSMTKIVKTLEDKQTNIEIAKTVSADLPLFIAVQNAIEKHSSMSSALTDIHDQAHRVSLKLIKPDVQITNLTLGELQLNRKPYDLLPRPGSLRSTVNGGKVRVNEDSKITLIGKYNVRGTDDATCCITGIRAFPDNFIIMSDNNNNCVKLMSPDYKLLDTLRLNRPPFDLVLVTETEVAVTSPEANEIVVIKVKDRKALELSRSIQLSHDCYGIAVYQANFIVTSVSGKCVKMIDMNGIEKWTIQTDQQGKALFVWPWYVAVHDQTHELYVSDRNRNTIVRAFTSGEYRKCFHAEDTGPRGMTIDGKGNLLICHFMTDEVQLQSIGVFDEVSLLGTKHDGIEHPQCITTLHGKPQFIVSSYNADIIKVYMLN